MLNKKMENTTFYRFEFNTHSTNSFDDGSYKLLIPNIQLNLRKFKLIKETNKGFWICPEYSNNREYYQWISKTSKKRFAYPTQEEALNNFILRTKRRISILKNQLNSCETALSIAEKKQY